MARTDADSWDLSSSVGATATMVAAARALASREPDPLIDDPYAASLVRAVGIEYFTKLVDGELPADEAAATGIRLLTDAMAVRTRFFDDFFRDAGAAGVRQAVILAAGLDSRAYRLPWPPGTVVYEVDQQAVIEAKTAAMEQLGATPTADRRAVAVDLRDDWPRALRDGGFDPSAPSAWSVEGLLMYLPPDAQDRLFDNITELSCPGSRVATEFHGGDFGGALAERAKEITSELDFSQLFYPGERNHAVDYLAEHGWQVTTRERPQLFADYGRQFPTDSALAPLRGSVAITATRDEEASHGTH
ncbi:methyltransferase, putative, TIGR00027 family [Mycolicibacterium chubuense NBB4]|uniref:S-adenosyl-L-methionine-dependent methyltransferase n=1 Tax=Mycolicibacterium chubuense (strain NBB4) TaxID=710421 RepID=I4BES4_MYCCN|nr:class I SAM-dependent methyltransferase [Mycolicibacterium chubuense]AFM15781.1 methyltransferase, putative, TIGR00027 family [Mycolicibacterium chubuense NBB4]